MNNSIIVVDCQYDFIQGSLQCQNSNNAIDNIIDYINKNPDSKVYYTKDYHSNTNKSFKENGGIWPVHCVRNTQGSKLDPKFYNKIKNPKQRPDKETIYLKGQDDNIEEYSGYYAKNKQGKILNQEIGETVVVCGLASEFCVRETALEIKKSGKNTKLLKKGVGYVNKENHEKNLKDLEKKEIKII